MKKLLLIAALATCPLLAQDVPEQQSEEVSQNALEQKDAKLKEILDALTPEENEQVNAFVVDCLKEMKETVRKVLDESQEIQDLDNKWKQLAIEHEVIGKIKQELQQADLDDNLPLASFNITPVV